MTLTMEKRRKSLIGRAANNANYGRGRPSRLNTWSLEDVALLLKLRDDDKLEWELICPHFPNRRPAQVIARYHYATRHKPGGSARYVLQMPERTRVTPQQAAERAARAAGYDARDITQSFFGDPPVGFSALERRKPARQQPSLPVVNILSADTPSLDASLEDQMFAYGERALRVSGDAR